MKRISIAGVDGSGKTTLITSLRDEYHERILYSPQTYKESTLPLYELSLAIDKIGKWADQNKVPVLKGISLFLGMTLYKEITTFIEKKEKPKRLIVERHPIIDTMAYAKFFLPMLNKDMPKNQIDQGLNQVLNEHELNLVDAHIKSLTSNQYSLANLNYFIFNLLNHDRVTVFNNLKNFYQLNPPDLYLILKMNSEVVASRFQGRESVGAHENAKILMVLQNEMIEICEFVKNIDHQFNFKILDANQSAPQVKLEVLKNLNL